MTSSRVLFSSALVLDVLTGQKAFAAKKESLDSLQSQISTRALSIQVRKRGCVRCERSEQNLTVELLASPYHNLIRDSFD